MAEQDINIKILYSTEGEDQVKEAQQQTAELGDQTKQQKTDVSELTKANKNNVDSLKALGGSALGLVSKMGVVGVAIGVGVKLFKSAVDITDKYAKENEKLRSSYATLTTTINTQAGTIINDKQLKEDVKKVSDQLKLSQEKITEAMTKGVEETNSYTISMEAVKKAYELAEAGVGTFEENYEKMIGAYSGSFTVFDETGRALQPGLDAFNAYYEQVKDKGDKAYGEMLVAQYAFEQANEAITQTVGENANIMKNDILDLYTGVVNAFRTWDWKELINLLIIDPINIALREITTAVNDVLGLINSLFHTNLSVGTPQISRLTNKAETYDQIQEQWATNPPDYVEIPSASSILSGAGSLAGGININVEGSIWETENLVSAIGSMIFGNLKLRGGR